MVSHESVLDAAQAEKTVPENGEIDPARNKEPGFSAQGSKKSDSVGRGMCENEQYHNDMY